MSDDDDWYQPQDYCTCPNGHPPCSYCTENGREICGYCGGGYSPKEARTRYLPFEFRPKSEFVHEECELLERKEIKIKYAIATAIATISTLLGLAIKVTAW